MKTLKDLDAIIDNSNHLDDNFKTYVGTLANEERATSKKSVLEKLNNLRNEYLKEYEIFGMIIGP